MIDYNKKYRRKPLTVNAARALTMMTLFENDEFDKMPIWLQEEYEQGNAVFDEEVRVKGAEGWYVVAPGQWIIRGPMGNLYPCDAKVFDETYEPVEDNE